MFLSAAEAAELLGISPQRMRDLLQKNRVQGARKIYRVWVVPVFEDGKPRISSGKRGPKATWNLQQSKHQADRILDISVGASKRIAPTFRIRFPCSA